MLGVSQMGMCLSLRSVKLCVTLLEFSGSDQK